jgi:HAD superfamily hydrolase (TIGR01484 family)
MKPLNQISKKDLKSIKMIVFDVDGVLVPRGTKIKQIRNTTTLETKVIHKKQIEQIKKLNKLGFLINISSGRGLYMLQEMFREILPFVSLTYECGSATWYRGKIYQHINSFERTKNILPKLKKVTANNKNVKGFEPKEFIITIHCTKPDKKIEAVVKKDRNLITLWNGEAYDILIKKDQTKALGLRHAMKIFGLKKKNVMAVGDNYNDHELLEESGMPISADKSRVKGKFYVPLKGKFLPADELMQKILSLLLGLKNV